MATLAELQTRREALAASRSSGVARVSYDGKTVEYRSLAEIDRAIDVLEDTTYQRLFLEKPVKTQRKPAIIRAFSFS